MKFHFSSQDPLGFFFAFNAFKVLIIHKNNLGLFMAYFKLILGICSLIF